MNKNLNLSEKNNFFALGPTFRSHQKEINRNPRWPDLWSIPNQCIITESDTIEIPSYVSNVKPGVELTAVIGGELWQSTTKEAWDSIAGFTISNDVTVTSEWPGWPESNKMKTNFGYKMFPTFKPISSQYQEKKRD